MAVKRKTQKSASRKKKSSRLDPVFDTAETLSGAEFHRLRADAVRYFYTEYKGSDLMADLYAWMKDAGYNRQQISAARRAGTDRLTVAAVYARCLRLGMPDYHTDHAEYWESLAGTMGKMQPVSDRLRELIDQAIAHDTADEEEENSAEPEQPKKTIQDHLREKAEAVGGEMEGIIDEFVSGDMRDPNSNVVIERLHAENAPVQQISIVAEPFEIALTEIQEVQKGEDEQLIEAYQNWSKVQLRNFARFLEKAIADCNNYVQAKKVQRKPRAKKAQSPQKVVAKFKYLQEFAELGLKSESPTKLIDASEAWLYNTKTRKLIHVVADEYAKTFTVKGSSIAGFDTAKTVQKTLRKPAEQLKQFAKSGKPAARKLFKEIKATEIKFTGRSNEHIIILRAH